jgi:thiaminase/transcriptional activator TenA
MLRFGLVAPVLLGWLLASAPAEEFTDEVWNENLDIYEAILAHPFLEGMTDGSLAKETFAFYLVQDAFYLREFARALEVTASKAPRQDWKELLMQHARESVEAEMSLNKAVLEDYGFSKEKQEAMEPAPEAFAYMSFLVATAYSRPFEESIAALLPCYWIYWEVGKELLAAGSKDPNYQKWIDNYASEGYGETVEAVMDIANEAARKADQQTVSKMKEHFRRASRYEWMFWDSAYARRRWPP